ncbi:MAG: hypothetical protein HFH93_04550 [Lachnospiraceae bacterium]|nr:hypothetical protein [Lachnospiraceae bacterium]
MDNHKNEMEQIQRGLEAFLEKEMENVRNGGSRGKRGGGAGASPEEEIRIIDLPPDGGQTRRPWEPEDACAGEWEPGEEPEAGEWEDWEEEPEAGEWEDWEEESEAGEWEDWEETARPFRRRGNRYEAGEEEPPRRGNRYGESEEEPPRRGNRYEESEEEPPRRHNRYKESEEKPPRKRKKEHAEYQEEKAASGKKKVRKKGNSKETENEQKEDSRMSKGKQKGRNTQRKPHKKKSRLKRFLIAAVLIIALLGVGLYQLVGAVYAKMNYRELEAEAAEPMKQDGVINILLIGNDSRENGEDGRSDAMILLSISSRTKKIYMTSLLRDIYVDIPGYEGNRLNAAYAFGGARLLMDTIEQNFDIPVNRYILVNFEAFANLVDAVGGIDLELSKGEIEYVNGYLWEYNMLTGRPDGTDNMDASVAENGPVEVHLNGPQALAYSRNRYIGTDFGRTERQRKILTAVIGKLPGAVLTNAGGLVDSLMPNLTTNLTQSECFRLSLMAGKLLTYDIVSDNIPQPDTYTDVTIRGMAVLQVNFEANIKYLKEKIYGE